ncbi:MAG: recombinase family protein [Clostridium sp.]|nr:MAG: recombinase family protein [Clostridium sp.]
MFVGEYVDDGYSGTDFDRPGFNLMMEDLKKGLINLVIVKDLSRLGRDHILTRLLCGKIIFPEKWYTIYIYTREL